MIPFSVLDLSPVTDDSDAAQSFRNTVDLAQQAERLGYRRYWLAEHHNMTGVASAATAVLIGHIAGATHTIRVGSGGIMLPNHAPLVIAEQFGTLASLYPGRIDLGVGRAPGGDGHTMQALRRSASAADHFPQDVRELEFYFQPATDGQPVRAVPGAGLDVPIWILGSSLFGAQLAAAFGLPFAFASHFAPDHLADALHLYRTQFQPSDTWPQPYVMLAMNVFAADTDDEARFHFTSLQQQFLNLRFGTPGKIPPPVADVTDSWHHLQQAAVKKALACSAIGAPDTVRHAIRNFIAAHQPDEIITTATIYDHAARLRSFAIAADVLKSL